MKAVAPIALIIATLAAVAGGAFLLVRASSSDGIEIVLPTAEPTSEVELKVYLSGAVQEPGVYSAEEGDRLADVIARAGGATEEADLDAVNMAVRVRDADHWHIPRVGEEVAGSQAQGAETQDKIDLNSADAALLQTLPGIGETRAEAIIRYREANGGFSSVD